MNAEAAVLEASIKGRLPGYASGPFPLADIRKVCDEDRVDVHGDIHGEFVMYFAEVAGYTVSTRHLHEKPTVELLKIKERLSLSFFARFPQFEHYRQRITPAATPNLHQHLSAVEFNRVDLVKLIDVIVAGRDTVAG